MRSSLFCLALLAFVALAAPMALSTPASAATVINAVPYITRPTGPVLLDASIPDGPGLHPVVIIVHGGGFARGSRITYVPPIFQPITAARFAWFTIDYRLAPQATVQDQVGDVLAAVTWVISHSWHYKLDTHRIVLLGESAGAYLVDYVALTAPFDDPIAAVISFYGPHDLTLNNAAAKMPPDMRTFFGVDNRKPDALKPNALPVDTVHLPAPSTDLGPVDPETTLRGISPYFMVRPKLPPFLLLHGTADEQVPYEQSPRFCEALKAKGNSCELYTVQNGRHGMGQWEENAGQLAYKQKVISWLKQTLH